MGLTGWLWEAWTLLLRSKGTHACLLLKHGRESGFVHLNYLIVGCVSSATSDSSPSHGLQSARLPVHGVFQARILEWVAISFSNLVVDLLLINRKVHREETS